MGIALLRVTSSRRRLRDALVFYAKESQNQKVLRLTFEKELAQRAVATSCGISSSTVSSYLDRFKVSGLPWPLPETLDDDALEKYLFRPEPVTGVLRPMPDWSEIQKELRRKHVTLSLLWQEYRGVHPDGYEDARASLTMRGRPCQ